MPIVNQIAPADAVIPAEQHLAEAVAFVARLQSEAVTCALRLCKSGEVDATPDTTAAAYLAAECDFTGYAAAQLETAVFEPFVDSEDGSYLVVVPSQQFNHGAVGVANTVGVWFIIDSDDKILLAGNLPEPVTLTGPLDSLVLGVGRRFGP